MGSDPALLHLLVVLVLLHQHREVRVSVIFGPGAPASHLKLARRQQLLCMFFGVFLEYAPKKIDCEVYSFLFAVFQTRAKLVDPT